MQPDRATLLVKTPQKQIAFSKEQNSKIYKTLVPNCHAVIAKQGYNPQMHTNKIGELVIPVVQAASWLSDNICSCQHFIDLITFAPLTGGAGQAWHHYTACHQ